MTPEELIHKFSDLNIWKDGDKRAPNKPLLILYALGKLSSQNTRRLSFADCEDMYSELLREYGTPSNRKPRPEHAFYRLKKDAGGSIWTISDPNNNLIEDESGGVRITALRNPNIEAGFTTELLETFDQHPELVTRIADYILSSHFPETLHSDILDSVGLASIHSVGTPRRRDPNFRPKVLTAYEYQCAICGFSLRLGTVPIALEAAHIKWHQAKGPETVNNGLALCCLHHKLFDLGAFTLSENYCVEASELINSEGKNTILDYHGKEIFIPPNPERRPTLEYLQWHRSEVFKRAIR
jgi:putative restriction endonuclease